MSDGVSSCTWRCGTGEHERQRAKAGGRTDQQPQAVVQHPKGLDTRDDDTLPARGLTEPLPDGVGVGVALSEDDLSMMVSAYYRARGWDADGGIPAGKLRELGLGRLVAESIPV